MTTESVLDTKQITSQDQLDEILLNKINIQCNQMYIQDVTIKNSQLKQLIEKLSISELQLQNVETEAIVEINQSEIKRLIIGQCNKATQIILNCENLTDLSVIGNEELRSFWSQHKHLALDTLEIELNPQLTAVENISTELLFCQENDQIELSKVQELLVNQQLLKTLIYSQYSDSNEANSCIDFLDLIRFSALESLKLSNIIIKEFEGLQYLYKLQKLDVSGCQIETTDGDVPSQELNCVLRQVVFRRLQTNDLDFLTNPAFAQLQQIQLEFSGNLISKAFRPQSARKSTQVSEQNGQNPLEKQFSGLMCVLGSIKKCVIRVDQAEAVQVARIAAAIIRNAPIRPNLVVNGQEIPLFPQDVSGNKQQVTFQSTPMPQSAKQQTRSQVQQEVKGEENEPLCPWTSEEQSAPRTFDDMQNEIWDQIGKAKTSIQQVALFRRSLWGMKLPSAAKRDLEATQAIQSATNQEVTELRVENAQLRAHIDQLLRAQSAVAFQTAFSGAEQKTEEMQASRVSNSGLQSSQGPLQALGASDSGVGPRPLSGVRFKRNALAPMEFSRK